MFQEVIACLLGVGIGTYIQYSYSLHYYEGHHIGERVLSVKYPKWYSPPVVPFLTMLPPYNSIEGFDRLFRTMLSITAVWGLERIADEFAYEATLDYAHYLLSFLCYRKKDYEGACGALACVNDFNLWLAGMEFYLRAVGENNSWLFRVLYERELSMRVFAIHGVDNGAMLASAKFFVEGWKKSEE